MDDPNAVQPGETAASTTGEETKSEPTVEELKAGLEAERALRLSAEEGERNARKDIIAIKKGKKRDEVSSEELKPNEPAPQAQPTDYAAIAAEQTRVMAEMARALSAKGMSTPTGGAGQAESPAPKPKGYWSDEQKAFLKEKRGMSDAMIAKAERLAQTNGAQREIEMSNAKNPARKY